VAAHADGAAAERELMERGWMTDMSAMQMPWGMAKRISPRAPGQEGEPSADLPGPLMRPGSGTTSRTLLQLVFFVCAFGCCFQRGFICPSAEVGDEVEQIGVGSCSHV
jgi:hypothetical protein